MDHLMNKFSIYHMLDCFVPGLVLTFEIYNILPVPLRKMFMGHTWLMMMIFIVLSFVIGLLNNHISHYLISIYHDENVEKNGKSALKNIKDFIQGSIRKFANYRRKKLAMKMENEFHVSVEDVIVENEEEIEKQPEEIIDIIVDEQDQLFAYIKDSLLPEIIKQSSNEEIYEYIYLYLQSKEIKNRLADFLTQKGLNRNLCSFCVASAVLSIFLSIDTNIFLSVFYKLILVCLFLLVGLVFYKEYKIVESKIKKYMLMWYIQHNEN